MNAAKVWALVPVKRFAGAKQRLSARLDAEQRAMLARAMLEDVLDALSRTSGLAGIAVVTVDDDASSVARRHGARVIADHAEHGHTTAVVSGAAQLARDGATAVVTMPGDIPLITADEVTAVIAAAEHDRGFVIVPAHDRRGSNAILATPPGVVPLQFGDDSFLPHLESARRCGIEPVVLPLPGIGLDIDHPQDLVLLLQRPSRTRAQALLAEMPEATCR
ncbi:MAG: 2-phospho-L-lactate guanylyltransferase [Betaproteobacteria bacterium]|nr:2-phospho-L-lactate guanylyltransferase [Betaproteobacteria bacterium]